MIRVGDEAEVRRVITESDVDRFVELTGDDNKLHVDEMYAAGTSFKRPVVHGMLGASFISTVIGTRLPGDGALWYAQRLEFLLPVRIGDEISVKARVIRKIEQTSSIELETTIVNQHGQKVTTGVASVRIVQSETATGPVVAEPTLKTALVLGASGGIGAAVAMRLAQDGFSQVLHCHSNRDRVNALRARIAALGHTAYVCAANLDDEQSLDELAAQCERHLGTITVVVNCALGRITSARFEETRWSDIQRQIDTSLRGYFRLLKALVPAMERQRYGKIISLTSQAIETPNAEWLAYITGKSALHGFIRALAINLAPKGIRVNMVSPGTTDTDFIADLPEKRRLIIAATTPLRRLATPEDIAGVVGFLASASSDFLAGETIRVNGGQVML